MHKLRKRVKVSIDLGNSMIKGTAYDGENLIKFKLPNKYQFKRTVSPKAKGLSFNGKMIYFGVGQLNNNVLKHTRSYLLEQVLVAIHEMFPNENNLVVDLKTGLPPVQLFNEVYLAEFKEKFESDEPFEFTVNGVFKTVEINSVEVFAEGYSGFFSIVDKLTTKQRILSIDVGGGTTDLCSYEYDYDDMLYYPDETETIEKGVIDFAEDIANLFNREEGADIKSLLIDSVLKNDLDSFEYNDTAYMIKDYIRAIIPTVEDMINKITNKFGKLDQYAVVGLGGGYKTFDLIAKDEISKKIDIDSETQFFANSLGYLEQ